MKILHPPQILQQDWEYFVNKGMKAFLAKWNEEEKISVETIGPQVNSCNRSLRQQTNIITFEHTCLVLLMFFCRFFVSVQLAFLHFTDILHVFSKVTLWPTKLTQWTADHLVYVFNQEDVSAVFSRISNIFSEAVWKDKRVIFYLLQGPLNSKGEKLKNSKVFLNIISKLGKAEEQFSQKRHFLKIYLMA